MLARSPQEASGAAEHEYGTIVRHQLNRQFLRKNIPCEQIFAAGG